MKLKESVKIECKKTQQRKKERERINRTWQVTVSTYDYFFRQSETDTKIFRRINEEAGLTCLDIFVGILCFFRFDGFLTVFWRCFRGDNINNDVRFFRDKTHSFWLLISSSFVSIFCYNSILLSIWFCRSSLLDVYLLILDFRCWFTISLFFSSEFFVFSRYSFKIIRFNKIRFKIDRCHCWWDCCRLRQNCCCDCRWALQIDSGQNLGIAGRRRLKFRRLG